MTHEQSTSGKTCMPSEDRAESVFDPFDLFDDGHPGAIRFERMVEADAEVSEPYQAPGARQK